MSDNYKVAAYGPNVLVEHIRYFPSVQERVNGRPLFDKKTKLPIMKRMPMSVSTLGINNPASFGPKLMTVSYRPVYGLKQVFPDHGPEPLQRVLIGETFSVKFIRPKSDAPIVKWAACPGGVRPDFSYLNPPPQFPRQPVPTRAELDKIAKDWAAGKNTTLDDLRNEKVIDRRFTNRRDFANWLKFYTLGNFRAAVDAVIDLTQTQWATHVEKLTNDNAYKGGKGK